VQYGVLPHGEAERLNAVVTDRKRNTRLGITSPSPAKKKKKKVKILKEEGHDPDMMTSSGDMVGRTSL
jgi:hypothetical protein